MDVSQLCSTSPDKYPKMSSKKIFHEDENKLENVDSKTGFGSNKNSSKLDGNAATSSTSSIANVLNQCSKLCESIWQLKLQHNTMSNIERETVIENLSELAKQAFKDIQSTEKFISNEKTTYNKRRNQGQSEHDDEDYEEYDDDDEDEDEDDEHVDDQQSKSVNKDHAEYELIRQARNLQNSSSQSRPKYRRRNRRNMIGQKCHSCGTTETPEWRRGPDGARTLCNACGLHYSKLLKKGSIGVQTQNYLITGGSPRVSTSSTVLQAQSIRNSSFNFKAIEVSPHTVNFPFVLMDPKYLDKRFGTMKQQTSVSAPKQQSFHTPSPPPQQQRQLPSLSSTLAANNESNFVNINPLQKLPLPSLNEANRNTTDNINSNTVNNSSNTINPLRIHQWKQTE